MPHIEESNVIKGLFCVKLPTFADERGYFMETFRKEWFPQRSWEIFQCNRSESIAGTLRGLHYHHHQVDYWYVTRGRLRVGLFDLRAASPSYQAVETVEMGDQNPIGLYIPSGVAHGFLALSDVTLTYIVDNYYDGADELGVAWNDPDIGLDWGVEPRFVSPRDEANPRYRDIAPQDLPA